MNRNLEQTNFHELFRVITSLSVRMDGADIKPESEISMFTETFDDGMLYMARKVLAAILACEPEEITFTYNGPCMCLNVNGEEIDHFYK